MNRIRQIREQKKLSQSQLAELCNTTQPTIYRLENGERQLTEKWMKVIARALDVNPADLIDIMTAAEMSDDVALYVGRDRLVAGPLQSIGLAIYTVLSDSVALAGLHPSTPIVVDTRSDAISSISMGDVVVVQVSTPSGEKALILRQFVPPALLVTNRPGSNVAVSLDDPTYTMSIFGVVRRE